MQEASRLDRRLRSRRFVAASREVLVTGEYSERAPASVEDE